MPAEVSPSHDQQSATDLVTRARNGDQQAWNALVERYAPLIWSICRRYRLAGADADDVGQSVWLRLVDHLGDLRDPAALPGWLATTTQRECLRALRAAQRPPAAASMIDAENIPDQHTQIAEQEVLRAEQHAALHEALTHLPARCQQLIALLTQDPPVPYAQISATLGIPVGSIGPTRNRCLAKLRCHPAIAALINAEAAPAGPTTTSPRERGHVCPLPDRRRDQRVTSQRARAAPGGRPGPPPQCDPDPLTRLGAARR